MSFTHLRVICEFDKLRNIMLYGNEKGNGHSLVEDWINKKVYETVMELLRKS